MQAGFDNAYRVPGLPPTTDHPECVLSRKKNAPRLFNLKRGFRAWLGLALGPGACPAGRAGYRGARVRDGSRSVPTAPRTFRGARRPTDSRAVGV